MLIRPILTILITIQLCHSAYSQSNLPKKWRVGWYGEIDFAGAVGTPLLSQDSIGTLDCNVPAWNNIGNMIIYSNGFNVYDANMDIMSGAPLIYDSTYLADPSIYGSSMPYGSIIVPRPDYFNQFYIFHTSLRGPDSANIIYGELYYSLIDMNLNNGHGMITPVKNVLMDDSTWMGYLGAVRHGNGRDWWLVSGRNYSNVINSWLVLSDTIIGPFSQPVGLSLTWPQALNQTQFSPDGNRFALAYAEHIGQTKSFILADFDRCSGQILNPLMVQFSDNDQSAWGVTGIEFSSSGRFLYAGSGSYLYQFDLWSSNIQNSKVLVKTHDHFPSPFPSSFSAAKRGSDNKIYMATGAGNYAIDVINSPDSLGVACDVQLRQINYYLQFGATSAMNILVMPNYPDYTLGALVGSPCDTLTGFMDIHSADTGISIYPNPTTGSITIQLPAGSTGKTKFELVDLLGRNVYALDFINLSKTPIIVLPVKIINGVYVCRIVTDGRVYSEKLILDR